MHKRGPENLLNFGQKFNVKFYFNSNYIEKYILFLGMRPKI
jgi:hypothetical protein